MTKPVSPEPLGEFGDDHRRLRRIFDAQARFEILLEVFDAHELDMGSRTRFRHLGEARILADNQDICVSCERTRTWEEFIASQPKDVCHARTYQKWLT